MLCNACGSRYLVKRSLEGYQPLQTRREAGGKQQLDDNSKPAATAGARRATAAAAGRVSKPKRAAPKRSIDSDAWRSDVEDSQGSDTPLYLTDDSAASRRASARLAGALSLPGAAVAVAAAALEERAVEREPSVRAAAAASRLKLSYITSQAQLAQELGSANLRSIAGALFASSLRLKPRKPLVVKVAAVW